TGRVGRGFLLFYSFMGAWYGQDAHTSYFYSFAFLLLKYKVTVFSANIGYAYNKEREKLSLNLRHNRKKQ
ncbi:hypothetical protein, partial [Leyella stercorea]|uniref:hypothetical protein n=1 Tax=Leyella stercorea TaxID=363265 RepID=UPI0024327491